MGSGDSGPPGTWAGEPQWIIERLRTLGSMNYGEIAKGVGVYGAHRSYRQTIWRIHTGRQSGARLLPKLRRLLLNKGLAAYSKLEEREASAGSEPLAPPREYFEGHAPTAATLPRLDITPKPTRRRFIAAEPAIAPPSPPQPSARSRHTRAPRKTSRARRERQAERAAEQSRALAQQTLQQWQQSRTQPQEVTPAWIPASNRPADYDWPAILQRLQRQGFPVRWADQTGSGPLVTCSRCGTHVSPANAWTFSPVGALPFIRCLPCVAQWLTLIMGNAPNDVMKRQDTTLTALVERVYS
jgi:hypothetical protein